MLWGNNPVDPVTAAMLGTWGRVPKFQLSAFRSFAGKEPLL